MNTTGTSLMDRHRCRPPIRKHLGTRRKQEWTNPFGGWHFLFTDNLTTFLVAIWMNNARVGERRCRRGCRKGDGVNDYRSFSFVPKRGNEAIAVSRCYCKQPPWGLDFNELFLLLTSSLTSCFPVSPASALSAAPRHLVRWHTHWRLQRATGQIQHRL